MLIGICGKSSSGKSTLAREIIQEYKGKAIHLDIDKIGQKVLIGKDIQDDLITCFGDSVIIDNKIDRKILGKIVFNSNVEMDKLTDITLKHMQIEIDNFLEENKDKIIVFDWILLSISKYFQMCDITILLDIPYEIRKQRAMKRDNITEDAFALKEQASIDYDIDYFDYIIQENNQNEIKKLIKEKHPLKDWKI